MKARSSNTCEFSMSDGGFTRFGFTVTYLVVMHTCPLVVAPSLGLPLLVAGCSYRSPKRCPLRSEGALTGLG